MNFGLTSEYDLLKIHLIKKDGFVSGGSKAKRAGATQLGNKRKEKRALQIHKYFSLRPHEEETSELTPCIAGCHSLLGLRGRFHSGPPEG